MKDSLMTCMAYCDESCKVTGALNANNALTSPLVVAGVDGSTSHVRRVCSKSVFESDMSVYAVCRQD